MLYVHGKGGGTRVVPLPLSAVAPIRSYRLARGLNPDPSAYEVLSLIHGFKGGALETGGLYDEIKLIFKSITETLRIAPNRTIWQWVAKGVYRLLAIITFPGYCLEHCRILDRRLPAPAAR